MNRARQIYTKHPRESRGLDAPEAFRQAFWDHLYFTRGSAFQSAKPHDAYMALSYAVRDYLIERWKATSARYYVQNPKFVCYLSAEYLPGRQIGQNLLYTGSTDLARAALEDAGLDFDAIVALDPEPGLGNGGLGRLASCFLDSLATQDIPAIAYGIRYEFGIFRQTFEDGWQSEQPDTWLRFGSPWEFPQPDDMVEVGFGGHTEWFADENGDRRVRWVAGEHVLGEPCHMLVPGYATDTVLTLRLWRARASDEFDFRLFDVGDYARAVEQKTQSENITKVLYPNDHTPQGRELRLRQQYFFVACSISDIIRRFRFRNEDLRELPDKAVIHLNDTHPVLAIAELMRVLVDQERFGWDQAWQITSRTFASTQHTLLPESLEKWPVSLFSRLFPRHFEIISEINGRFLDEVRRRFPNDEARVARMSIIEEGPERLVRMAHLAAVGSSSINGVSELQSRLLANRLLSDFHDLWPSKFSNKSNGVSLRRFVHLANPRLSRLITASIGEGWLHDADRLSELEAFAEDLEFRRAWREIKLHNKADLADLIGRELGLVVAPASLFDIMAKRLHEYKRQLLKVLHIVALYDRIKRDPATPLQPRTCIFGAKAAPGYRIAKLIIKLINSVATVVNGDRDLAGRLAVAFLPDFNVSLGERLYPAADLSEQISMAGQEAAGTGNMKFALNGALTIGTLDGANVEIRACVGAESFFAFGLAVEEVFALKDRGYRPADFYDSDPELKRTVDRIASGEFSHGDTQLFQPIVDLLLREDPYLNLADFASYVRCQDEVEKAYQDVEGWTRRSILNAARCGFFSSDRAIRQYSEDIWHVRPLTDIQVGVS